MTLSPPPRAIVLDLDGPLLEGRDRHFRCYAAILQERGFEPIDIDAYWHLKRNRVDRRQLLSMSNAAGIYDEFLAAWMGRIETREYLGHDHVHPHVIDILDRWSRNGIVLFLATLRNKPETLMWQLERTGLKPFFEKIIPVGSASGSSGKASFVRPVIGSYAREDLVWIGDTEVDIAAARELSIRVWALTCGLRTGEYLQSLNPDHLLPDLQAVEAEFF